MLLLSTIKSYSYPRKRHKQSMRLVKKLQVIHVCKRDIRIMYTCPIAWFLFSTSEPPDLTPQNNRMKNVKKCIQNGQFRGFLCDEI